MSSNTYNAPNTPEDTLEAFLTRKTLSKFTHRKNKSIQRTHDFKLYFIHNLIELLSGIYVERMLNTMKAMHKLQSREILNNRHIKQQLYMKKINNDLVCSFCSEPHELGSVSHRTP